MRTLISTCVSAVIALAIAAAAHAQPPQTPPGQAKKQTAPNQTADHGTGDASPELTPADQDLLQRLFGKNESAVVQTLLSDGTVQLELDESFEEAIAVTITPDGSLTFSDFTGLANASKAVTTVKTDAKKPAITLEEK